MKLYIDDSTNSAKSLYYQSLILLFLPCEKFGEDSLNNELYVNAFQSNGKNFVKIKLVVGDRNSTQEANQDIDNSVISQMKNLIGRTLLKAAFKLFNVSPPWGISTGVKPVKLARILVELFGANEAFSILCDEYMISPSKAKMAIEACLFENSIIKGFGDKPCSLYISIPFCPTKCNYCSFVSCTTPRLLSLIPEYMNSLERELVRISEIIKDLGLNMKSVYVGGGTPAILSERQIDNLLSTVYGRFNIDNNCEITFEAGRPDCITYEKLKVLSEYGIPRISINTQTTNDDILRSIGRNHSYSEFLCAFDYARKLGFKCINTDLIAGLPGEREKSFFKSVQDVLSLAPENITIHAFTLKKSSYYRTDGLNTYTIDSDAAVRMTDYASELLQKSCYKPYYVYRQKNTVGNLENVGYSIKGFESIYNIIMMGEYHTVFGAGAGSVTKIVTQNGCKVDRIFSPKYPYEFLDSNKYSGFDGNAVSDLIRKGD